MSKNDRVILYSFMIILGNIMGIIIAKKDIEIEKLKRQRSTLQQEIIDYKWQLEQVPYIIESWCNGE